MELLIQPIEFAVPILKKNITGNDNNMKISVNNGCAILNRPSKPYIGHKQQHG